MSVIDEIKDQMRKEGKRGKIRRIRCAKCGRKIRDWRKVRKQRVHFFGSFASVYVCSKCGGE